MFVCCRQDQVRQRVKDAAAVKAMGSLPGRPSAGALLLPTMSSGLFSQPSQASSQASPEKAVPMGAIPARRSGTRAFGGPLMGELPASARQHDHADLDSKCVCETNQISSAGLINIGGICSRAFIGRPYRSISHHAIGHGPPSVQWCACAVKMENVQGQQGNYWGKYCFAGHPEDASETERVARMASMDSAYGSREYQENPTAPPAPDDGVDIPLGTPTGPSDAASSDAVSNTTNISVVPGGNKGLVSRATGMFGKNTGSGVRVIEGGDEPTAFGNSRF